jgi:hypothetical protein
MSKIAKNYFIGDPDHPHEIGQDKHGMVHCLVWGLIYEKGEFFADKDRHSIGIGGGGIGSAATIPEGRQMIFAYAIERLNEEKQRAQDLIRRVDETIARLGTDPENLEAFTGEYKQR